MNQLLVAIVTTLLLFTTGCSSTQDDTTASGDDAVGRGSTQTVALGMTMCGSDRRMVCTQEYEPVCAQLQDGDIQTYANSCTACADPLVTGYNDGGC